MYHTQPGRRTVWRYAFTLIELLVVISIIALLIALLLPALSKAKLAQRAMADSANAHGMLVALNVYAAENNAYGPNRGPVLGNGCEVNPLYTTIDTIDPMSGWKIWGVNSAGVNEAKGLGQLVTSDMLALDLLFCPAAKASTGNCTFENGTNVGPWRYTWNRKWLFGSAYTTNIATLPDYDGMPGMYKTATNWGCEGGYAYRSGDYSYTNNPGDIFYDAAAAAGFQAALGAYAPPAGYYTGVHGRAYAGPELTRSDNPVNSSWRAIVCDAWSTQHVDFTQDIESMTVGYADGSATFQRKIYYNYYRAPAHNGTAYTAIAGGLFWSGGSSLTGANMEYFDEDTARQNRRRGGSRPFANTGTVAPVAWGVAGAINAQERYQVFNALDWGARVSR